MKVGKRRYVGFPCFVRFVPVSGDTKESRLFVSDKYRSTIVIDRRELREQIEIKRPGNVGVEGKHYSGL